MVLGKIAVHIRLGLTLEHADVLRKAEGRDAVDDAEIDGLGVRALQRRDLRERHAEHLRRRDGVDVLPAAEGGDHRLVICDVREQAQLDLAVVRVHEHLAGRGHEHLADLRAELAAHGDILQVRLCRRQASRRRDGHLEVRMDAPVGGDLLEQPVGIGGLEFCERAVIEDLLDDGVLAAQLVEHGGVCAPAGLGLFPGRKHEPLEQNAAKLLRRLDVERLARERPDALLELLDAAREALAEVVQCLAVDQKARLLHARQHRAQRQLNVRVERQHGLSVHFFVQRRLRRWA